MTRSPYIVEKTSVSIVMLKVLLALLPGIVAYVWVYGSGILVTLAIAAASALASAALMLRLR